MSEPRRSLLQRIEPPLILLLVAVLALLIWRPWHKPTLDIPANNTPVTNGQPKTNTDGVANRPDTDGKKDGAPIVEGPKNIPDYGSFHQGVKPNEWATTDSRDRLTGSINFVKSSDPEGKAGGKVVSGRTHDGDGNWLAGCRITLTFFVLQPGQPQRTQAYRDGYSDSAGRYRIGLRYPLVEGARLWLTVGATREGYAESETEGRDPAGDLTEVLLKVRRPGRVQGVVLDDDDKPVPDARVFFTPERVKREGWPDKLVEPGMGAMMETRTNAQGAFTLEVGERFFSVSAAKDGYVNAEGNVGVTGKSGETIGLPRSLVLRKVSELRLRVANLEKMPDLAQIEAKFFDGDKLAGTQLLNGVGDRFSGNLPSITPGTYRLELWEFRGKRLLTLSAVEVMARTATDLGDIRIEPEK
ncbi:MAG: carboxypeptidase regulatory-like domain-containing protein [Planctomycetes bacterium]|nr:carboxypeptidase regulatory-like domain-containing protein [Planctomycetota bacterium]